VAAPATGQSHPVPLSAGDVFKKAGPAVVVISTPSGAFGSGVLVDGSGSVVTNLHVIVGSKAAQVRLANNDTYDDVMVVDVDRARDLAVLKLKAMALAHAELGDSDEVRVGDSVYAIGSPQRLSQTFSQGIVSGFREADGHRMIQTTAPISPGSSGGGLFDAAGRLVGITSSRIVDGENLNFAVPINYVRVLLAGQQSYPLSELATRVPRLMVSRLDLPLLASVYVNAGRDELVLERRGDQVHATFRSRAGSITGNAQLSWNPTLHGFEGSGTTVIRCGTKGGRLEIPVTIEQLFIVEEHGADGARMVRTRWLNPDRIDCARRTATGFAWREELWER